MEEKQSKLEWLIVAFLVFFVGISVFGLLTGVR